MLPYGGSIQQSVYYTSDNLCAGSEDIGDNLKPTSRSPDDGPFILMVDRGECTFVTKVRNAQHYGAAAVLIADDKCMYKQQQQQQRQTTCSFIRREPDMSHNSRLFLSFFLCSLLFPALLSRFPLIIITLNNILPKIKLTHPCPNLRQFDHHYPFCKTTLHYKNHQANAVVHAPVRSRASLWNP